MLTIMDEVLSRPPHNSHTRSLWDRLNAARYKATRFIFSDRASDLMGRFAFGCGDLLLANRQFAIPPFDVTYVEMNSREFFKHTKRLAFPMIASDMTIGYLTVGPDVYSFVRGDPSHKDSNPPAVLGLVSWTVQPPGGDRAKRDLNLEGDGGSWVHLGAALGTTFEQIADEETRLSLMQEIGLTWLPGPIKETQVPSVLQYLQHTAGDIRKSLDDAALDQPPKQDGL